MRVGGGKNLLCIASLRNLCSQITALLSTRSRARSYSVCFSLFYLYYSISLCLSSLYCPFCPVFVNFFVCLFDSGSFVPSVSVPPSLLLSLSRDSFVYWKEPNERSRMISYSLSLYLSRSPTLARSLALSLALALFLSASLSLSFFLDIVVRVSVCRCVL